jgi:hypothetical protein
MSPPQPPTTMTTTTRRDPPLHRAAAVTTLAIAALYALIFAGVLSVGRADAGELGILGVAGVAHLVLAAALWAWPRRILFVGTALLQLLLAAMYVAIAPERDPSYEVWGLAIRSLSLVLVVLLVAAFVQTRRVRREGG